MNRFTLGLNFSFIITSVHKFTQEKVKEVYLTEGTLHLINFFLLI